MPLPAGVTTATLTFGPYLDATGSPACPGLTGWVQPSQSVVHLASGTVILDAAIQVTVGDTGTATIALPHTDQNGLSVVGFTYALTWDDHAYLPSPPPGAFALPFAAGVSVDYDLLTPSAVTVGVLVPVGIPPALVAQIDQLLATVAAQGQAITALTQRVKALEDGYGAGLSTYLPFYPATY